MKKYFLVVSLVSLIACSDYVNVPESSQNVKEVFGNQCFREYNKMHRNLFEDIYSIQNKQNQDTKEELLALLKLYQSNRGEYEYIVRQKLTSLIGEEKFNALEMKVTELQSRANALLNTTEYSKLSPKEKDELYVQLSYNLPRVSQVMKSKGFLTRSVSESECLQDCAETRDEAIEEAAIAALCGIGVGLAVCLGTVGVGSVGGLIEAFLAAYQGDVAITNAQNAYERCIKKC